MSRSRESQLSASPEDVRQTLESWDPLEHDFPVEQQEQPVTEAASPEPRELVNAAEEHETKEFRKTLEAAEMFIAETIKIKNELKRTQLDYAPISVPSELKKNSSALVERINAITTEYDEMQLSHRSFRKLSDQLEDVLFHIEQAPLQTIADVEALSRRVSEYREKALEFHETLQRADTLLRTRGAYLGQLKNVLAKENQLHENKDYYEWIGRIHEQRTKIKRALKTKTGLIRGFGVFNKKNIESLKAEDAALAAKEAHLKDVYQGIFYEGYLLPGVRKIATHTLLPELSHYGYRLENVLGKKIALFYSQAYESLPSFHPTELVKNDRMPYEEKVTLEESVYSDIKKTEFEKNYWPLIKEGSEGLDIKESDIDQMFELFLYWVANKSLPADIPHSRRLAELFIEAYRGVVNVPKLYLNEGFYDKEKEYDSIASFLTYFNDHRAQFLWLESLKSSEKEFDFAGFMYDRMLTGAVDQSKKSEEYISLEHFAINVENECWRIFADNPSLRKRFGEETISFVDKFLSKRAALKTVASLGEKHLEKLVHSFPDQRLAPFVLLIERELQPKNNRTLDKYWMQVEQDGLDEVYQRHPALKAYFDPLDIHAAESDEDRVKIYDRSYTQFLGECLNGNDALEREAALVSLDTARDTLIFNEVITFLKQSDHVTDRHVVYDFLLKKLSRGSEQALETMLAAPEEEVRRINLLKAIPYIGGSSAEQYIEPLSRKIGISPEDIRLLIGFIHWSIRLSGANFNNVVDQYDVTRISDYLELYGNPEKRTMVELLVQEGYPYAIKDVLLLEEVYKQKGQVFEELRAWQEIMPGFQYTPTAEYEQGRLISACVLPDEVYAKKHIIEIPDEEAWEDKNEAEKDAWLKIKQRAFDSFLMYDPYKLLNATYFFREEIGVLPEETRENLIRVFIGECPNYLLHDGTPEIWKMNEVEFELLIDKFKHDGPHKFIQLYHDSAVPRKLVLLAMIQNNQFLKIHETEKIERFTPADVDPRLENEIIKQYGLLPPSKRLKFYEVIKELAKDVLDIEQLAEQGNLPWLKMLQRMRGLQAQAERDEHDPWKQELDPLVERSVNVEIISATNERDAELVYSFVQNFGMYSLRNIFDIYCRMSRAETIEDVEGNLGDLRANLGNIIPDAIEETASRSHPNGKKNFLAFKGLVLNELRQMRDTIQKSLLDDTAGIELMSTVYSRELFDSVKGSTSWRTHDSPELVINRWRQTTETSPEVAELPEGYREVTISVPKIKKRKLSAEKETALIERQQKIVANPDLTIALNKLDDSFRETRRARIDRGESGHFGTEPFAVFLTAAERSLYEIRTGIESKKEALEEKLNKTENPKAQESLKRQIGALFETLERLSNISVDEYRAVAHQEKAEDEATVRFIEQLFRELPESVSERNTALQRLTALHIFSLASNEMKQQIWNMLADRMAKSDAAFSPEAVGNWRNILVDYVAEHYLQPMQEIGHTGHAPFSKELVKQLRMIWGVKNIKENIVVKSEAALSALEDSEVVASKEMLDVSLVPSRGLLRIYSGDLGDACFTSQHMEFASGGFPSLTSYTFVTGRGTKFERFVGSVLAIETKTPEGEPVLLVRANNPRESLLSQVDAEVLVSKTLEEMKALAKRRGINIVVVPLDVVSASCSNRAKVADYYHANFKVKDRVSLVNEPVTNFNGYRNWNAEGSNRVVNINS